MKIGTDLILLVLIAVVLFSFPLWARLFPKKTDKPAEAPTGHAEARKSGPATAPKRDS